LRPVVYEYTVAVIMLCDITRVQQISKGLTMSVGSSGRIVIEIEPELKQELHSALKKDGTNLKSWFLENVDHFLSAKRESIQSSEMEVDHEV